jgi:hypothetical protein
MSFQKPHDIGQGNQRKHHSLGQLNIYRPEGIEAHPQAFGYI